MLVVPFKYTNEPPPRTNATFVIKVTRVSEGWSVAIGEEDQPRTWARAQDAHNTIIQMLRMNCHRGDTIKCTIEDGDVDEGSWSPDQAQVWFGLRMGLVV